MIRVVVTHPNGRIGARTVRSPGHIPLAVGEILLGFGADEPRSFRLKILEVEPDEMPGDVDQERAAQKIAQRLIVNVGRKLIERGFE